MCSLAVFGFSFENPTKSLVVIPGDEDAQQINVVSPSQQHDQTKSQLEKKQPLDNLVNPVTLAQSQEIQIVQVGSNEGDPCVEAEATY